MDNPFSKNPERDMRIIRHIAGGKNQADTARELGIGSPVICGVVRRYRQVTGKWNFARTRRSPDTINPQPQRRRGYIAPARAEKPMTCPTPQPASRDRFAALFAEADRLIAQP